MVRRSILHGAEGEHKETEIRYTREKEAYNNTMATVLDESEYEVSVFTFFQCLQGRFITAGDLLAGRRIEDRQYHKASVKINDWDFMHFDDEYTQLLRLPLHVMSVRDEESADRLYLDCCPALPIEAAPIEKCEQLSRYFLYIVLFDFIIF